LRSLVVGIVGGIIAYYATKGIDRYVARRTVRGRRTQIMQLTQELRLLAKLGESDRNLLLFAFRILFPIIAVAAVGLAGSAVLVLLSRPLEPSPTILSILIWSVIALLAIYASNLFKRLDDPGPAMAKVRQRLSDLEAEDGEPPVR
jgi:hypothetical protein